ncbi:AIPR family protein [Mesorhizobium caraganae]|uniref:AIPR family protein n=1 Tax=Mesorhizobium caraganae TaxID=483206 RepID=UPI00177D5DAF|nr:AIPR family protein [Mesorhizobium caraganae]
MSDDVLIKSILTKNKGRYGSGLDDGEAFEYFCAEAVLKRYALTFDDIDSGIVDGMNDGGIDSVYVFVNRSLIAEDTDLDSFKSPVEIDLYVIQSKMDGGFKEAAMASLVTSIPELIKLGVDPAKLVTRYNSDVRQAFELYRDTLKSLAAQFPKVRVHVIYCTLATKANAKVDAMIDNAKAQIEAQYPKSECEINLWDAKRLYQEAQKQNVLVRQLPFVKSPISHGRGYVILSTLRDYFKFITDEDKKLIDALFEFNVRDYQSGAAVNKEIAATLGKTDDTADFWWLNNGVTILAEEAAAQDNELTIKNPIIVNGLQTSHEVFRFFAGGGKDDKERCVQVRVLQVEDDERRDRVIKATNSQTGIKPASLHATEPLQRKVEDYLVQLGIFYDRRKDFWRNKGRPADKIIGIDKLSQSVMSILLEKPHDARARPTTILRNDATYAQLFSDEIDLAIYQVAANLYFAIDTYFRKIRKTVDAIYRNNLRYHLMMSLAWRLNGSRPVHAQALKNLKVSTLTDSVIEVEFKHIMKLFNQAGAEDKTAKDQAFTATLKKKSLVKESKLAAQKSDKGTASS